MTKKAFWIFYKEKKNKNKRLQKKLFFFFFNQDTQTKLAFDEQKTDHVELENNGSAA